MGQPIGIMRTELSASDLRALAVMSGDGATVRRLFAMRSVAGGALPNSGGERERDDPADLAGLGSSLQHRRR